MSDLDRRLLLGAAGIAGIAALSKISKAGPLSPPSGPISSTPGPECRTPINATTCPGDDSCIFKITQSGSYFLAADLVGQSNKNGILIDVASSAIVTIDLRGFSLRGGQASLNAIECRSTSGIIHVCNGKIAGWSGSGCVCAPAAACSFTLEHMEIRNCAGAGVACSPASSCVRFSACLFDVDCAVCHDGFSFSGTRSGANDQVCLDECRFCENTQHAATCSTTMSGGRLQWECCDSTCSFNGVDGICFEPTATGSTLHVITCDVACTSNGRHGEYIGGTLTSCKLAVAATDLECADLSGDGFSVQCTLTDSTADVCAVGGRHCTCPTGFRVTPAMNNSRFSVSMQECVCHCNSGWGMRIAPTGTGSLVCWGDTLACSLNGQASQPGALGAYGFELSCPASITCAADISNSSFCNNGAASAGGGGGGGGGCFISCTGSVDLSSCTCSSNAGDGARMVVTGSLTVDDDCCSSNTGDGLSFTCTGPAEISDCTCTSNARRGVVGGCGNGACMVSETDCSSNGATGMHLTCDGGSVSCSDCVSSSNAEHGFFIDCPVSSTGVGQGSFCVERCEGRDNTLAGMCCPTCRSGEITDSTFSDCHQGVLLLPGATCVEIECCSAKRNSVAGFEVQGLEALLLDNTASNNGPAGGLANNYAVGPDTALGPVINPGDLASNTNPHTNYNY